MIPREEIKVLGVDELNSMNNTDDDMSIDTDSDDDTEEGEVNEGHTTVGDDVWKNDRQHSNKDNNELSSANGKTRTNDNKKCSQEPYPYHHQHQHHHPKKPSSQVRNGNHQNNDKWEHIRYTGLPKPLRKKVIRTLQDQLIQDLVFSKCTRFHNTTNNNGKQRSCPETDNYQTVRYKVNNIMCNVKKGHTIQEIVHYFASSFNAVDKWDDAQQVQHILINVYRIALNCYHDVYQKEEKQHHQQQTGSTKNMPSLCERQPKQQEQQHQQRLPLRTSTTTATTISGAVTNNDKSSTNTIGIEPTIKRSCDNVQCSTDSVSTSPSLQPQHVQTNNNIIKRRDQGDPLAQRNSKSPPSSTKKATKVLQKSETTLPKSSSTGPLSELPPLQPESVEINNNNKRESDGNNHQTNTSVDSTASSPVATASSTSNDDDMSCQSIEENSSRGNDIRTKTAIVSKKCPSSLDAPQSIMASKPPQTNKSTNNDESNCQTKGKKHVETTPVRTRICPSSTTSDQGDSPDRQNDKSPLSSAKNTIRENEKIIMQESKTAIPESCGTGSVSGSLPSQPQHMENNNNKREHDGENNELTTKATKVNKESPSLLDSPPPITTTATTPKWQNLRIGSTVCTYRPDDGHYYDATVLQVFQPSNPSIFTLQYHGDKSTDTLDFEKMNERAFYILDRNDRKSNSGGPITSNDKNQAPPSLVSENDLSVLCHNKKTSEKRGSQTKNSWKQARFIFPNPIQKKVIKNLEEKLKEGLLDSVNSKLGGVWKFFFQHYKKEREEFQNDIDEMVKHIISNLEKGRPIEETFHDFAEVASLSMDMIDEADMQLVRKILIQAHGIFLQVYRDYQKDEQKRLQCILNGKRQPQREQEDAKCTADATTSRAVVHKNKNAMTEALRGATETPTKSSNDSNGPKKVASTPHYTGTLKYENTGTATGDDKSTNSNNAKKRDRPTKNENSARVSNKRSRPTKHQPNTFHDENATFDACDIETPEYAGATPVTPPADHIAKPSNTKINGIRDMETIGYTDAATVLAPTPTDHTKPTNKNGVRPGEGTHNNSDVPGVDTCDIEMSKDQSSLQLEADNGAFDDDPPRATSTVFNQNGFIPKVEAFKSMESRTSSLTALNDGEGELFIAENDLAVSDGRDLSEAEKTNFVDLLLEEFLQHQRKVDYGKSRNEIRDDIVLMSEWIITMMNNRRSVPYIMKETVAMDMYFMSPKQTGRLRRLLAKIQRMIDLGEANFCALSYKRECPGINSTSHTIN